MKQTITTAQLNELSGKARVRLDNYWNKINKLETYTKDLVIYPNGEIWEPKDPLLSIGQMIEFLDEKVKDLAIVRDREWWIGTILNGVTGEVKDFNDCNNIPEYKDMKLCDALWSAVKHILEK